MTPIGRFNLVASLVALLVGLQSNAVRAQSAFDGFDPGADNSHIMALAIQTDGKVVVGGGFATLGGGGTGTASRNFIGRLNPDGTIDNSFDPGANQGVFALAVQPDGKILVGGAFTMLGGGGTGTTERSHIGRLNADGSLDASFNPGASDNIYSLAVQADGKILVGGIFATLGGAPRNLIGRLNADGSLDATFDPGANNSVRIVLPQPDGRIIVGGGFTTLGGGGTGSTMRNHLGRLNADGSIDPGFDPGMNSPGPEDSVFTCALQPDGKIVVGGSFTMLGGGGSGTTPRNRIGRLNADGTLDTTFDPGADAHVLVLVIQPDGRILVGGFFSTLGGGGTGTTTRNFVGRLNADGSLDSAFNPGANNWVEAFAVQPDGKILISGYFTTLGGGGTGTTERNRIGRLHADGSLDADLNPGANNGILALAVQPDGKILVGGNFTMLGGGGTGTTVRNSLGRLHPDGSLDTTFNPGVNGDIYAVAVQPDGKILVGGLFTALGGGGTGTTARNQIGRLNSDGSLDTTFNPGANFYVLALALQSDGKILVGGRFTTLGGGGTGTTPRNRIGRLHSDGTLDATFNPGANEAVAVLTVQPDGKILVGGAFTMLGGGGTGATTRNYVGRLNADGSLDATFDPGATNTVTSLVVQPDGRIVLGGLFTALGGGTGTTTRNRIGRLLSGGAIDAGFNPGANDTVQALSAQADGQILVVGAFTTLGGGGIGTTTRNRIGRLHADGALDVDFNPGANDEVYAVAVQPDGKILVGGLFSMLGGGGTGTTGRNRIGRLTDSDASIQRLSVSCPGCVPTLSGAVQAQVTWARSAAGPEVARVTVEVSSDGTTYGPPTGATRVSGGWQTIQNVSGNANRFVRARGYYATGLENASGSIVESIRQVYIACPTIVPTQLASGIAGLPYAATFAASGALGIVSFSTASALPAGVMLSPAGMLAGTPTQTGIFPVTVTATDGSSGCADSRALTLTINPAPTMALDKTSLHFAVAFARLPLVPLPVVVGTGDQTVRLTQSGVGTVSWTATSSHPSFVVTPSSGIGSATLSIGIVRVPSPTLLSGTGTITFAFSGTTSAPGPIAVTVSVSPSQETTLGVIDTPLDNSSGVTGSVPFTGWALDTFEVERVTICRAAVIGETAPVDPRCATLAQIYVGDATFIDGARPDVQAAYPAYPRSGRAGWGFMVLTNSLPNQGNGTYVFYAYTYGVPIAAPFGPWTPRPTLLGTRTMMCANASATLPFGAIDTPTQGGTASGASFVNFGWALTPQPKLIPLNGSTITVLVDGASIGTVNYNHERPDIETFFPGFQNTAGSNGAVGFRMIDTTTLTNGLHTISWTVVDNQGAIEGIGSRFFTVSNGAGALTAAPRDDDARHRDRDGRARRGAGAGAPRLGPRGAVAVVWGRQQRARGDPRRRDRSLRSVAGRTAGCALHGPSARRRRISTAAGWRTARRSDRMVHVGAGRGVCRIVRPGVRALVRGAAGGAARGARDPRAERPRTRRRAGGDRHAALAARCRAAVRAGRVGGGSGRGDHYGHRHAARVGVSAGGRRAGVPGDADARGRAAGRRGDPWGPVPRHRVHARRAGADARHLRSGGVSVE